MEAQQKKVNVAMLSVLSNTTLVIFKLLTGWMIGSVAVMSEAIHSGIDLLASGIALFAVKTSGQPADDRHSYGHGKFESLSGAIEALLIFVAAAWIIFVSVHKIMHPSRIEAVGWGVAVMLFSSVINWIVSKKLFRVGQETDSIALQADGMHLLTDVYTSLGVMSGLIIYLSAVKFFPQYDWAWVDPLSAICVALLIIHAAYQLTRKSIEDLLDSSLPAEEEIEIKLIIETFNDQIYGYHNFRSRKSGPSRFVEAHVMLSPDMTVVMSHDLNDRIVTAVRASYPGTKVMLHLEPCLETCEPKCLESCLKKNTEQYQMAGLAS